MIKSKPIYFGGAGGSPEPYNSDTNLDALDYAEFQMIFAEWVTQCWLYDEEPPSDPLDLAAFDLGSLVPKFRRAFAAGDWRRMEKGRGVTLREYLTWSDLAGRTRFGVVLCDDRSAIGDANVPVPKDRKTLTLSDAELGACLAEYLRAARRAAVSSKAPEFVTGSPLPKEKRSGLGVMLFDPHTFAGHVISLREVSDDMMLIAYDDETWPDGKSMLSEGENSLGLRAEYLGDDAPGTWMVPTIQLTRIIFAIPLALIHFPWWTEIGAHATAQIMARAGLA